MKHLKVAASIVNLAIFVSCSISCSSNPPPSAGTAGHAMLAPHLPGAVANGQAAMTGAVSPQQPLKLATAAAKAVERADNLSQVAEN
jgi:hypothetical protein